MTGTRHDRREWSHRLPAWRSTTMPSYNANTWQLTVGISDWSGCYSHRAMHTISLYYLDDRSIFSRWRNRMINLVWTLGGLQDKCCTVQVVRSMPYFYSQHQQLSCFCVSRVWTHGCLPIVKVWHTDIVIRLCLPLTPQQEAFLGAHLYVQTHWTRTWQYISQCAWPGNRKNPGFFIRRNTLIDDDHISDSSHQCKAQYV